MVDSSDGSSQVSSFVGLMVAVIQSPSAGLRTVEHAAELIAEHARFNQWAYERKSRSTASEMWNISALVNQYYSDCLLAWQKLGAAADREAQLEEFLGVLESAADGLRTARESDSVDFDDPSMPQELREWF